VIIRRKRKLLLLEIREYAVFVSNVRRFDLVGAQHASGFARARGQILFGIERLHRLQKKSPSTPTKK
jgi:hypothetical protein